MQIWQTTTVIYFTAYWLHEEKGIDTAPKVTGQRYSRVAAVVQEQLQKYHAAYEKEDVQGALSSALDLIKFLNDFQDKENHGPLVEMI